MGELFKTQHTIDEMLDRMGVKIVLDTITYRKMMFLKRKRAVVQWY